MLLSLSLCSDAVCAELLRFERRGIPWAQTRSAQWTAAGHGPDPGSYFSSHCRGYSEGNYYVCGEFYL